MHDEVRSKLHVLGFYEHHYRVSQEDLLLVIRNASTDLKRLKANCGKLGMSGDDTTKHMSVLIGEYNSMVPKRFKINLS